jgi:FkbM family methyltransferase
MLARAVYPLFRRVDFRGKGRLRRRLPVPERGHPVAGFPGGVKLRLDLAESLQRDFLFGLYDQAELALLRRELRGGGDFVDVGAHIGMYTVAAAAALRGRGRVLALEPNPSARAQLEANLALNALDNAIVVSAAAGSAPGETVLHVPATPDPSFSSLEPGRFSEGEPVPVRMTTVDDEVEAAGLRPAAVKIDVEGGELDVVAGMSRVLELRPLLIVEVSETSGAELGRTLGKHGYEAFHVTGRRLTAGLRGAGLFNAVFRASR